MTEITTKYYVKVDSETGAIVEAPTGTKADGLIEVNVLPSTAEYLTRYWQHYQIVNSVPVKQLKWLPDLSIDHLLNVINVLEGNLSESNSTIKQYKAQLDQEDTKNSASISSTDDKVALHDEAILELSDMVMSQPSTTSTTAGGEA